MNVIRYSPDWRLEWDSFVAEAKNGTFLFQRGYMDYHANRYNDYSLGFKDEKGRLRAILPANRSASKMVSHGGLTYGGILCSVDMTTPLMLDVFDALIHHAKTSGFEHIRYKCVPTIYARLPAEEDRYALFRNNAVLVRRDVMSVITQARPGPLQERRRRKIRQAERAGLRVVDNGRLDLFWPVLVRNLMERHSVHPVHTLTEINLLAQRFPQNIKTHWVEDDYGNIVAGAIMYVTETVAHAQYITTSPEGREIGALDLLFSVLIRDRYVDKPFFDFGISNEDDGRVLNTGLIEQKEGFGARAVVHDHYEVALT